MSDSKIKDDKDNDHKNNEEPKKEDEEKILKEYNESINDLKKKFCSLIKKKWRTFKSRRKREGC